jgi:DNA-binding Lrp family transcriptional regulator
VNDVADKSEKTAAEGNVAAYVMCKVRMGYINQVVHALRQLEVATSIAVTTGECDVLVRFDVRNLEALYQLTTEKVGKIEGIERITTAIVEKEF